MTLALDGAPDSVRTSVTSDGLKAALRGSGEAGRKEGDEHIEDVMSSVTEKDGISVKKAGKKTTGAKKMAADDASGVDFFDALSDLLETLDNNKQQKRPAAAATGKPASPRK